MASWALLDERSESDLHKLRLLNVEEKPFKRITKRLTTISAIVQQTSLPTENEESEATPPPPPSTAQLQEDLTLDFAAFDSNIARLQFLRDANERERTRYESDKQRILEECQTVRERNGEHREHLEGARATLAQRKKFDDLAEKITSNRLLRPREDQIISLAKLEDECRELERESETYSLVWRERREQFNRIMEEGMMLRRQIRDEKEEVDRREGMVEDDGEDEAEPEKPVASGTATPRPDKAEDGEAKGDDDTPAGDSLQVPKVQSGNASRDVTPAAREDGEESEEGEAESGEEAEGDDVEMGDDSTPAPAEKMEVDE